MTPSFLTSFELGLCVNFAVFVATLIFSQKIKDFFTGVPADVRSTLKQFEAAALSRVKAAHVEAVNALVPASLLPAPVLKPIVSPEPPAPPAPSAAPAA